MSETTVVLTDASRELGTGSCRLSEEDGPVLPGAARWSITQRTLRGGVSEGVEVVEMDNGRLSVSILPTRGMGLWYGRYRSGNGEVLDLGWKSPVRRPVHPQFVNLAEHGGIGWLAGFNEWVCRCGLAWNGPPGTDEASGLPLTLHGKIANIPAHYVEAAVSTEGPGMLSVTGVVDETMFLGSRLRLTSTVRTEAGSNRLSIIDEVTNLAGRSAEMELLYHTNVGRPFLEAGAKFRAPVERLYPRDPQAAEGIDTWPDYEGPVPGFPEQVFFIEPVTDDSGNTVVLLRNAAGDKGLSLRFNRRQLPYFAQWKLTQAEEDGYVTGLEPATDLPYVRNVEREQGRLIELAPGASRRTQFDITVHDDAEQVAAVESEIRALQEGTEPVIDRTPPQT